MLFTCREGMFADEDESTDDEEKQKVNDRTVLELNRLSAQILSGDVKIEELTVGRNPKVQGKVATPLNLSKRRLVVDYQVMK